MALDRVTVLTTYLRSIVVAADALQEEKARLQDAAQRLPVINASLRDLQDDAQAVLDKLNTLQGTALTLADVRKNAGL